jgi:hypothetical protein
MEREMEDKPQATIEMLSPHSAKVKPEAQWNEQEQRWYWIQRVSGGLLSVPASEWANPTGRTTTMELQLDGIRENPRWQPGMPASRDNPPYFAAEVMRVTVPPGAHVVLPSFLDRAVQHTQCFHIECLQRPFTCTSTAEGHEKAIIGGLGPDLVRVSPRIAPGPMRHGTAQAATPMPAAPDIDSQLLVLMRRGAA